MTKKTATVATKKPAAKKAKTSKPKSDEKPVGDAAAATPEATDDDPTSKLTRLEARQQRITKANAFLEKCQHRVAQSTQAHKVATADLKSAIGQRDKATVELQRVIVDVKKGQDVLPGMDNLDETTITTISTEQSAVVGTTENWPISELGSKRMKEICGAEAIEAAKNADDPIGLSDKQLEKLESAEFATIADLEKKMAEDSWWWKKVAADGQSAIVQRVISTLLAFRKVHPHVEKTPTILDKLAEQNLAESPAAHVPAETVA